MKNADLRITPTDDPSILHKRIGDAVSMRAYQIFERRGRAAGRDREDWKLAESDVVRPLCCCGVLELDDKVELAADLQEFDLARGIEILAEPHCLTLCGRPPGKAGPEIFRTVQMPAEVDVARIECDLEEHLLKVRIFKVAQPIYREQASVAWE
ncbi:MAG: Hsp20/alpha crystallin family protein [Candidatus Acidiferrales bacterium]|jgi:HSP20 family molecular chaperone IbpA